MSYQKIENNILIEGDINLTGTVDGRDVAVDGTNQDNHIANTNNPHSVTMNQVTNTTTKGDLIVETGSGVTRLPVGINGSILRANSAEISGVEWGTSPSQYDTIVDAGGDGDYTSIVDAFNGGHQTVFVRDGTYSETEDIIIPDGGALIGESMDGVVISFVGAYCVRVDGSDGTYESVGTISIANGSSTVTGVSTTFLNLNPVGSDTYIIIGSNAYPVASVTNNTTLTIGLTYQGRSLSGVSYIAQHMKSTVNLNNLTIVNSTSYAVCLRALRYASMENIVMRNCATGCDIRECSNIVLNTFIAQNTGGIGFNVVNTYSGIFNTCQAFNSGSNGFEIAGTSKNIIMNSCQSNNGNNFGLNITGTADNTQINSCIFNNNSSQGINTESGTLSAVISDCNISYNGSVGIEFDGLNKSITFCMIHNNASYGIQASDNGRISSNHIYNNGSHGINMITNDCVASDNIIDGNTGNGIYLDDNNNIISNNNIRNNTQHGILVTSTSLNNNIEGNYIYNNSLNGIQVQTLSTNNKISGNQILNNTIGINVLSGCINTTITNNTCTSNSSHGLVISANTCSATSNKVYGNGGDGCVISSGATDVTVLANSFLGNSGTDFNDSGTISSLEGILINSLDARSATTLKLGESIATKVEIADTGVTTEVQGNLDALSGLDVTGAITVTGTVDGRDIAVDGTTLDNHVSATSAHGTASAIVGISDSQTLTNKTINSASNTINLNANTITSGILPVNRGGTGNSSLNANSFLIGNGTNAILTIKSNFSATSSPTLTDDSTEGYTVGSRWLDTTNNKEYVCLDATVDTAIWIDTTVSEGTGEANNGTNIGTAGVGIFKNKSGVNLQFKKLNNGSNKVTITDDTGNDEVDIDIEPANILINDLSGAPNGSVVGTTDTQTLTNKTIDGIDNTITNLNATSIGDGSVSNTEFQYLDGLSSGIQTQLNDRIPYDNGNMIRIENGSPGDTNHIQFVVTKDTLADSYNLGIDTSDPCKVIWSAEDSIYRQAMVLASDESSTGTIFGVSRSANTGSSWQPVLVAKQNLRVGINTNNPSDTLEVNGNIVVSGTVDGRDIATDGTTQDSHIAATTAHGVTGNIVGTTDTQSLTNKTLAIGSNTFTGTFNNAQISQSSVTQHQAAINHDLLLGFVANEHIDWTQDAGSNKIADINITASSITQHQASINHDALLNYVANEHIDWTIDAGSNNINDANILASSITQHEASINHDNLLGFVANEHIDWTIDNVTNDIHENNISQVSVTQHEAAINHDSLAGFVANEHIDWTVDQGATNINIANITSDAITQYESSINHDNLLGYLENEHLDWTIDQGANNIHPNNITEGSVTQHQSAIDHGALSGILDDDHTQYALLLGRSGGQTLNGGTSASNNLTLNSTSNVTKGNVIIDGLKYPNSDGSTNQVLKTDGSGNLSFGTVDFVIVDTATTTNATLTTLGTVGTTTNTSYVVDITIIGRRTDSGSESAGYHFKTLFRNISGTLSKVSEDKLILEDTPQWDASLSVSGTNILIRVKGQTSKTISWKSSTKVLSV